MRYLALLLVVTLPLLAQKPDAFTDPDRAKKVEAASAIAHGMLKEFYENRRLPGLVYGVMVDGKLVTTGSYGFTNVAEKREADTKSLFRIASMSKSVTALAIVQLRDAGKLRLDDPASKYVPEMKKMKYLSKDAPDITVRDLMTHSAGFPEDNPWGDRQLGDSDNDLKRLIEGGVSFSNVPGITFEYANLGFALLGRIVQNVSGMSFERYTTEKIFRPLGMHSTVWDYPKAPPTRLAHGYRWKDEAWVEEALLRHGSWGAMGGLITSIEDWAKYVALHLSAYPPRNDRESPVLKRSSLREMHQPWRFSGLNADYRFPNGRTCASVTAYGYGLRWMQDCDGRVNIGHSGGLPGFGSNWTIFPDHGIGIMSFDNLTYAGTATVNLAILDSLIGAAALEPRAIPPSDILLKRMDELISVLPDFKDADKRTLFAENFFPDTDIDTWRKRAQELYADIGSIVTVHPIKPMNQLRGTFVVEGEKGNLEVFFTLTSEKNPLVQQLRIRKRGKD